MDANSSVVARRTLLALRQPLMELHKALLEAERLELERLVGPLNGAEFLRVALTDPRLAWLAPLTELVARLDDAIARSDSQGEDATDAAGEAFSSARSLVAPPDPTTTFGRRYLEVLQDHPAVVLAHGRVTAQLRRSPVPAEGIGYDR